MPLTTINGCKHFYEDAGQGDVLVLLHGASGSAQSFAPIIPRLAEGFRVIAPDLRAMGRSEHVAAIPPTAWNDDLTDLLDQLGATAVHLYGVSLGSRIAMRMAIDQPRRVRTLTVDSAIIANDPAGNTALNTTFRGELPKERVEQYRQWHGEDWQTVVANYTSIRNVPELQERYNLRNEVARITCPMLIVRGDIDDAVHPLAHTVEIHAKVPHSWMWIAPNQALSPVRERPDEFLQLFHRFIAAGVAPAPAART